jgi:hypothetical protein
MSFMSDFGARYIDNGYHILPIMPGSKAPGLYRINHYEGYTGWANIVPAQQR